MHLAEIRLQALRYLALEEFDKALRLYSHVVQCLPTDLDARMKIADVCVQTGNVERAGEVYAAVAQIDLHGGRPLHALVAIRALKDLGFEVGPAYATLVELYNADSPRIGKQGGRIAAPLGDTLIEPPKLPRKDSLDAAVADAAAVAANSRTVRDFPTTFHKVPLLSELTPDCLARVLETVTIRRAGHGATVIRQGDTGDACYLLADGTLRVFVVDTASETPGNERITPEEIELARLHEGSMLGEMALVSAQPRAASVEVIESADLVVLGRDALLAAASEMEALRAAVERFARERLLRNLLTTSPLFRAFDESQRVDLIRRFTGHEVEAGTEVITEGNEGLGLYLILTGGAEVRRGEEPFDEVLANLKPGDCFGEIALIRNTPATATVRTTENSTLLFLAREYFERLTAALPQMREYFENLTESRLREGADDLNELSIDEVEFLM